MVEITTRAVTALALVLCGSGCDGGSPKEKSHQETAPDAALEKEAPAPKGAYKVETREPATQGKKPPAENKPDKPATASGGQQPQSSADDKEVVHKGKSLREWIALLKDKNDLTRLDAADAIKEIGPRAREAVPALVAVLKGDRNDLAWTAALGAIGAIGREAKEAVPTLIVLLRDKEANTRCLVIGTLGHLGPAARDAVPAVIALLKDPDQNVREWADRALLLDLSKANVAAMFDAYRRTRVLDDRWLDGITAKHDYAVPDLANALKDQDWLVRSMALQGLAKIGPKAKAAVPAIQQLLKDKKEGIREAAAKALKQIDPDAVGKVPPIGEKDGETDAANRIVKELLGANSDYYKARGFKEYTFGTSRKEVEAISPITGKVRARPSWVVNKDQVELLFSNTDELVGLHKVYRDDNQTYVEKLEDLFGKADKDNVETFSIVREFDLGGGARQLVREERTRLTYVFARSIVVVSPVVSATAFTDGGKRSDQFVAMSIYDADWVQQHLTKDIKYKRKVLEWLRASVKIAVDEPEVRQLKYVGAVREERSGGNFKGVYYLDAKLREEQKKVPQQAPDWFCAFVKLTQRTPENPKDALIITLRFDSVPDTELNPVCKTELFSKVIRYNSALAQEYFPPKGEMITVVTKKDSAFKTFEWLTKENLKVQITSQNTVIITKSPGDL